MKWIAAGGIFTVGMLLGWICCALCVANAQRVRRRVHIGRRLRRSILGQSVPRPHRGRLAIDEAAWMADSDFASHGHGRITS
jgi:hypothetical protein